MIDILYEDKDIIVVNKPSGMPSQRDFSRTLSMDDAVAKAIGSKPFIIHRLDRFVAGPVVLSKTKQSAAALNKQLTSEGFTKLYKAVVIDTGLTKLNKSLVRDTDSTLFETGDKNVSETDDKSMPCRVTLINYLKKDKNIASAIRKEDYDHLKETDKKNYKLAKLDFKVSDRANVDGNKLLLLSIKLYTGRFHQIRVQLSAGGLPILGDKKYGSDLPVSDLPECKSISLQCVTLGFKHPTTGKKLEFNTYHQDAGFKYFDK